MNGEEIDCFVDSLQDKTIKGILCTVDNQKKDSEIKILVGCTDIEIKVAYKYLNKLKFFRALLIKK